MSEGLKEVIQQKYGEAALRAKAGRCTSSGWGPPSPAASKRHSACAVASSAPVSSRPSGSPVGPTLM